MCYKSLKYLVVLHYMARLYCIFKLVLYCILCIMLICNRHNAVLYYITNVEIHL